jgi:DNA repair and recombination protein RAD52
MDWEIAKPLLEAKLNPAHVKKPSGSFGPKGDYIEGWHAIAEANRIFGFGGWSYSIKTMTQDSLKEGKTAKGDMQWQAAYTCIVTVTVGDVVREDVGFGSGFAKQIGDAVEGATKEAVTDALKRALRTFGNSFGLALYDKSRENVGVTPPPFDASAVHDRIKAAIDKQTTSAALDGLWAHNQTKAAMAQLHGDAQAELQAQYTDRMGEIA